jgi:hypothetical protein
MVMTPAGMIRMAKRPQMDHTNGARVSSLVDHAGWGNHNRQGLHDYPGRQVNDRRRKDGRNRKSKTDVETYVTGLRRGGRHADADC